MSDLTELYQQLILDHGRRPRNFHVHDMPTHVQRGYNPLCGDDLTLYLDVIDGVVKSVSFQGKGCAISIASASLLTERLPGKPIVEVGKLFSSFHDLVTVGASERQKQDLGKLVVLAGVTKFPMRVKCATLAWHTLMSALDGKSDVVVSTDEEDI